MEPHSSTLKLSEDDIETVLEWANIARNGGEELAIRIARLLPRIKREGWVDHFRHLTTEDEIETEEITLDPTPGEGGTIAVQRDEDDSR